MASSIRNLTIFSVASDNLRRTDVSAAFPDDLQAAKICFACLLCGHDHNNQRSVCVIFAFALRRTKLAYEDNSTKPNKNDGFHKDINQGWEWRETSERAKCHRPLYWVWQKSWFEFQILVDQRSWPRTIYFPSWYGGSYQRCVNIYIMCFLFFEKLWLM